MNIERITKAIEDEANKLDAEDNMVAAYALRTVIRDNNAETIERFAHLVIRAAKFGSAV